MNATNCFSINMSSGLVEGMNLTLRRPLPGPSNLVVPHLLVGANYVKRGIGAQGCDYTPINGMGLVYQASLKTVVPEKGTPFSVLNKPNTGSDLLLFVDHSLLVPKVVVIKPEVEALQLRSGTSGSAEVVLANAHQALVNFTQDGQDLFIRYPTGLVEGIVRKDNRLWPVELNPAEMAKVWLNCAEEALAALPEGKDSIRRREGILFGVIKLLRVAMDPEARDLVVDFLSNKQEEDLLSVTMKSMIYGLLGRWDDLRRYTFDRNSNVVEITSRPRTGAPKERQQKVRARAARDRIANGHSTANNKDSGKKKAGKKGG